MADNEFEAVRLFAFCDQLVTKKLRYNWPVAGMDAEDLIKDLFIDLYEKNRFNPDPALALTIAKNMIFDALRREGRRNDLPEPEAVASGWRSITSQLNALELFNLFQESLKTEDRKIFEYLKRHHNYQRDITDDSGASVQLCPQPDQRFIVEMANHLGISPAAATKRLSRIRAAYVQFHVDMERPKHWASFHREIERFQKCNRLGPDGWLLVFDLVNVCGSAKTELEELCEIGAIDARWDSARGWVIRPEELWRWRYGADGDHEGDRSWKSFQELKSALGAGFGARRVVWNSDRGLLAYRSGLFKLEMSSQKSSEKYRMIFDCIYDPKDWKTIQSYKPYEPTTEDLASKDWVKHARIPIV